MSVVVVEGLEQRFLPGVQSDARELAPGAHAIGVRRLREAVRDGAAVVEPHELPV